MFTVMPRMWGSALSSDPRGLSLSDVNECDSSPCSQECANVYGSYQCYCRRGYQLSDVDGVTCEGEDARSWESTLHPLLLSALSGWRVVCFFPLIEIYWVHFTHH